MSKKIKKTIEEKLEDIGIQQITVDDLLYPRESRKKGKYVAKSSERGHSASK